MRLKYRENKKNNKFPLFDPIFSQLPNTVFSCTYQVQLRFYYIIMCIILLRHKTPMLYYVYAKPFSFHDASCVKLFKRMTSQDNTHTIYRTSPHLTSMSCKTIRKRHDFFHIIPFEGIQHRRYICYFLRQSAHTHIHNRRNQLKFNLK